MWNYVISLVVLGHGLGHALFLANAWGAWRTESTRSWLLGSAPTFVEGSFGLLWLLPLVAFGAVAYGLTSQQEWLRVAA